MEYIIYLLQCIIELELGCSNCEFYEFDTSYILFFFPDSLEDLGLENFHLNLPVLYERRHMLSIA